MGKFSVEVFCGKPCAEGGIIVRVKLPRSGAERAAALGSEANRNGDGRAQYYFSRSQRFPLRIPLFH